MMNQRFQKLLLLIAGLAMVLLVAAAGPALAQDRDFDRRSAKLERVLAKWKRVNAKTRTMPTREAVFANKRRLKKLGSPNEEAASENDGRRALAQIESRRVIWDSLRFVDAANRGFRHAAIDWSDPFGSWNYKSDTGTWPSLQSIADDHGRDFERVQDGGGRHAQSAVGQDIRPLGRHTSPALDIRETLRRSVRFREKDV